MSQNMGGFIPQSFNTDEKNYSKKQKKVLEIIKEVIRDTEKISTPANTIYHESKMIIKKKRLSKELDDNEVYWLCVSLWGARLCGMEL